MFRRMALLIAVAVLLVPQAAGATELTNPTEVTEAGPVPETASITLAGLPSSHIVLESTTLGTFECGPISMSGSLTSNFNKRVDVLFGSSTPIPCTLEGEAAEIVDEAGHFFVGGQSGEEGHGAATFGFTIQIPNLPTPCEYWERAGSAANFSFVSGTRAIEFEEWSREELESQPSYCGEGELSFSGGMNLDTDIAPPTLQATGAEAPQLRLAAGMPKRVSVGSPVTLVQQSPISAEGTYGSMSSCLPELSAEVVRNSGGTLKVIATGGNYEGFCEGIVNLEGTVSFTDPESGTALLTLETDQLGSQHRCVYTAASSVTFSVTDQNVIEFDVSGQPVFQGSDGWCGIIEPSGGSLEIRTPGGTALNIE